MRSALTIAGSDPSGGAGVQGDLKTFHAHGVYGMAVITALTAQNTEGVFGVHDVPAAFVALQLERLLDDMPVHAAKTGMVSVVPTIEAIADVLARRPVPHLVVDPVMIATSGAALLRPEAVEAVLERLFPLAAVATPNLPEAERLCGFPVRDPASMREAARALHRRGPRAVLVKGGHLPGPRLLDLLYDGSSFREYEGPRIETRHTHGTGCALSAGIAARLALGDPLEEAVRAAREFVRRGLERAVVLGRGTNPLNHLAGAAGPR